MITIEQIKEALKNLSDDFRVHTIDKAWYTGLPIVRIELPPNLNSDDGYPSGGMLEIHPAKDNPEKLLLLCYCCFGGEPDQGCVPLSELSDRIAGLRGHYCPPWPG